MTVDWALIRSMPDCYHVIVSDNYHYQDPDEQYAITGFASEAEALAECREMSILLNLAKALMKSIPPIQCLAMIPRLSGPRAVRQSSFRGGTMPESMRAGSCARRLRPEASKQHQQIGSQGLTHQRGSTWLSM